MTTEQHPQTRLRGHKCNRKGHDDQDHEPRQSIETQNLVEFAVAANDNQD